MTSRVLPLQVPNPGLLLLLVLFFFAGALAGLRAADAGPDLVPNDKCLECHSMQDLTRTNAAGQELSLFTDEALLRASVHATNACVSCHRDLATAWDHPDDGRAVQPVQCALCHERQSLTYNASVHAKALHEGKPGAATCQDCHGHHEIHPIRSPDSPLNTARITESCGQCHSEQAADVAESVHGLAAARGHRQAPTCLDCHAEHQIEDLRTASPLKISEQICGKCHASERLNTRFRLPGRQVDTFFDSYHGLAARGGSTEAANCASCHGWHKILPSTDPRSTIHPNQLVATCGQCHPGIGQGFATGKVHFDDLTDDGLGMTVNRWVRRAYIALIFAVVGLLALHNGAAWFQKARAAYRRSNRTIVRMDGAQRFQHLVLLTSFILLALTGFALRFPNSWWTGIFGTEDVRRWLHRGAGLVLLGIGAWHLVYLVVSAEGRRLCRDLLPRWQDWRDLRTNTRFLAGRSTVRPRFARFGYAEKIEYWAVVWGTIIMGVTGLMIWLKIDVTQFFPRWVIDVAITIHYYEAILACLAIIVWHFYHVFFDPEVYPGNFAWLDGKVTPEWQAHEHPGETLPPAADLAATNATSGDSPGQPHPSTYPPDSADSGPTPGSQNPRLPT